MSPSFALPGDPGGIRGKAGELRARAVQFVQVADGLDAIRTDGWVSLAADRFREEFVPEAGRWRDAGAGFQRAATGLDGYAAALESARATAEWAEGEHRRGDAVTHQARSEYDADVRRGQREKRESEAQGIPFTLTILPFHDPGESIRRGALVAYEKAKGDVRQAASVAAAEVRAGCAGAPASRSWWETGLAFIGDVFVGIYEGVEGLAKLAMLPQQQLMGFFDDIAALTTGRLTVDELAMKYRIQAEDAANFARMVWEHPGDVAIAVGKGILDWDTWSDDPAKAIGHLIPDIILTIATAGAGKVAGSADDVARGVEGAARAAAHLDDLGDLARVESRLPGATRRLDDLVTCGDPVDVGTGRVVLSATDVVIDGALPLVLTRTYSSTRRAGGWFGPGWVSAVDEALLVGGDGCVLLLPDSSALSFPLPQSGMPVTALTGRRRLTLACAEGATGDFEVTDPIAGVVRGYRRLGRREGVAGLVEVRDRCGRWIRLEREHPLVPEIVTAVTTSGGGRVDMSVEDGRIVALSVLDRGEAVVVRRFGYDAVGRLDAVWVGDHETPTRFAYDELGRMSGWVDTNGTRYDYVYDEASRCVSQGSPNGDLAYTYDYSGHDEATGHRVTLVTDSLGAVRRYLVDPQARILAEVDPLGAVKAYDYDEWGNQVAVTDPLGAVTRAAYTEVGQISRVERADGTVVTIGYDPRWHRPVELVGPDGATVRLAYDERGLLVSHTDAAGATARFDYDERGCATGVVDPLGARSDVSCNDAGLVVQATDPLGALTRWERDGFGRVVAQMDALGGGVQQRLDTEGRVVRRVEADGAVRTWEFDGEGNCLGHVDAVGRETRMTYERFDLLTARTDPAGGQVRATYDTELRLTACVNELGLQWSYEHDPLGRVLREIDFNGRVVDYTRDMTGRVIQRRNAAGQTVGYEHDSLGRVVCSLTDAGERTDFSYDPAGRLVRAEADGVLVERTYDTAGRLISETVDGHVMTFAYDVAGRRVRRVTPSGVVSEWRHDALGQPVELRTGGHVLAFTRDRLGREVVRGVDTDLTFTSVWDSRHRLVGRSVVGSPAGQGIHTDIAYDASGAVASIVDSRWGAMQYDTDVAGRVVAARTRGAMSERYGYDPAGNIVEGTWPTDSASSGRVDPAAAVGQRDYLGTLVTRAGRDRFDYDAEGRLVVRRRHTLSGQVRQWRYTWDAHDRMTSVVTPDGVTWRYTYDPLGRRIAKSRLDATGAAVERVHFAWDGFVLVEQTREVTGQGTVTTSWEHQGWAPLVQHERRAAASPEQVDEQFYAIVTDLVGAPTELLTPAGESGWRQAKSLWGAPTPGWGPFAERGRASTPLRFPGQYADDETELYYNVFRHYDPGLGRYVTNDPLGLAPRVNSHAYPADPLTFIDPYGLVACETVAANTAVGFADDAVASAYQGMRSGGGHAIRHLRDEGLIANSGSLSSQVGQFERLTSPILRAPTRAFDWRVGETMTRAFAGEAGGRQVVVFVAKEGPYQGNVLSAVVPDAAQMAQWGLP